MQKLNINITKNNILYPITIDSNLLDKIDELFDFRGYTSIFIISDDNVAPLYLGKVSNSIAKSHDVPIDSFVFKAGENSKNLETVTEAIAKLVKLNIDRKALIINLGGGITTDMGGFIASTYLRGIDFINISTSIVGMVDASVGGKTGVNFEHLKNYIGVFNHPKAVIMDIDTLNTLPKKDFVAGFGEVIKHGLIYDKNYFELVTSKHPANFSKEELVEIIKKSCEIKADVVQKDERESGIRKILNFGHTAGHAFESLSFDTDTPLLHGEAVSLGMIVAAKLSELIGNITHEEFIKIESAIKESKLPILTSSYQLLAIKQKMKLDKKSINQKPKWTLLKSIGECDWNVEVGEKFIDEALNYVASPGRS